MIEKYKEILTFIRTGFYLVLTTLFAIIAYSFQSYDKLTMEKFFILYFLVIVLIVILFIILGFYKDYLDKLEDTK